MVVEGPKRLKRLLLLVIASSVMLLGVGQWGFTLLAQDLDTYMEIYPARVGELEIDGDEVELGRLEDATCE